ncbi:FAD-dependent oxidoreductase [Pseudaquabacterium rugosum]|uniref:FAD-dependent oxidoreductase n=1 Tax=Pseudaquabacterium rugosum TaxID=2984194 RepID=A0ABU9BEW9_9BURK
MADLSDVPRLGQPVALRRETVDLLVIGSGAGGLSAAVTAATLGLRVRVVEKAPVLGGTTAWSGGWMWLPGHADARAAGITDTPEAARTYLRHELGAHHDEARIEAFLRHAPAMVDYFRRHTAMDFVAGNGVPDFHGRSPGAVTGGRQLCAAPFDGRLLGADLQRLRPPLGLIAPWGMGIASGPDLRAFLRCTRDAGAAWHVLRRLVRHGLDLLRHGRGLHLVNGNALVARLLRSGLDRGVGFWCDAAAQGLLTVPGADGRPRVSGARIATPDGGIEVQARCGVVLACGGFPHDAARIAQRLAHARGGQPHWSAAPDSLTGDGLRLGEAVGAVVADDLAADAAWAPVSRVPQADGRCGHFPHLIERAKPGLIAVTRGGRRFVNEADSYFDFMSALFAALPPDEPARAWLLCDHRFLRRYGLGAVRPQPLPIGAHLRSGYLKRGDTLAALARACGIDAAVLQDTVATYNRHAARGEDPEFGRGGTPYNRVNGDAEHGPNPCVAPLGAGPYYAVEVLPGSLGTFAGLRCDARGRVLQADGAPIAGLWAAGNDMASVMGGRYPSGGITLGPAMTFGWIVGHDAAGREPGAEDGRPPAAATVAATEASAATATASATP